VDWVGVCEGSRDHRSEVVHPAANSFVGYHDTAFRQQIFDVAEAQGKPDVKPDRLLDDFQREPVPFVAIFFIPLASLANRKRGRKPELA
jgi:hypothetical protein